MPGTRAVSSCWGGRDCLHWLLRLPGLSPVQHFLGNVTLQALFEAFCAGGAVRGSAGAAALQGHWRPSSGLGAGPARD